MLSLLFVILLLAIFGRLIAFAIRAAWSIAKVLLFIVFLPLILIGIMAAGLIYLALPLLIIIGIIVLIKALLNR